MSGECILVIDDSKEIIKHLTERVLPNFGYTTLQATDGKKGLALIREKSPDLVMLDYNLPEMTGIDVLREMAQTGLNTPVVLMTGYGSELSAIEAFRLGAKDYLIKPFTIDEIVETIDRALMETRLLHDKEELAEQLRRAKVELSRQSQEMDTLFSIGKAITSLLDVNKVMQRVQEAARYLTNSEACAVWLANESETVLRAYGDEGRTFAQELPIEGSRIGEVLKTGRPFRYSAIGKKTQPSKGEPASQAILYVPLNLRGITLGVLEVRNIRLRRAFSRRDEFLLSFLADYAAIALENARVFQAADQALMAGLEELNTLIEITRTITSTLDLDEVIRLTINQVHDSWHIEASSLWLLDNRKQTLKVLANVGTPFELLSRFEVPLGKGFVGYVAETGKWIYTNKVANHELHFRQIDEVTGFSTRSLLCVPLLFGGQVVGALQLLNKLDGDFDDRDVERALSIAAAVAIAVTNALLFEEAETRKHHLAAVLDHTDMPILITNKQNKVVLLNQKAHKQLALAEDVVGLSVAEAVQMPGLSEVLAKAAADGIDLAQEVVLADGSAWRVHIVSIPEYGRIYTFYDKTKTYELDQAKDNFVATISHDMRSPLNSVMGFAGSLGEVGTLNDQQKLFVKSIQKSTRFMMDLVNGLLELAKVDTLQQTFQPCNLSRISRAVVNEYQEKAIHKNITLTFETSDSINSIVGDPTQIKSAVSNLVDNAIQYSPEGGVIQVNVAENDGEIIVQVQDEGPGISAEDLPHIFEKFYRGTNGMQNAEGVGLGLALVRSIVKAHGGDVWVESQPGQGSIFALRLPTLPALRNKKEIGD